MRRIQFAGKTELHRVSSIRVAAMSTISRQSQKSQKYDPLLLPPSSRKSDVEKSLRVSPRFVKIRSGKRYIGVSALLIVARRCRIAIRRALRRAKRLEYTLLPLSPYLPSRFPSIVENCTSKYKVEKSFSAREIYSNVEFSGINCIYIDANYI